MSDEGRAGKPTRLDYVDNKGGPGISAYGFSSVQKGYDALGWLNAIAYFDAKGKRRGAKEVSSQLLVVTFQRRSEFARGANPPEQAEAKERERLNLHGRGVPDRAIDGRKGLEPREGLVVLRHQWECVGLPCTESLLAGTTEQVLLHLLGGEVHRASSNAR
jgi:hypothetical protein